METGTLYACCEHCTHADRQGEGHTRPCPEGCNDAEAHR
jgi:hypothetical protein